MALLARGEAGLSAAAKEVSSRGGQPLPISVDTADHEQVDAVAARVERELGPIDAWVNIAFASVSAPFMKISSEEYQRVTEVTYLGACDDFDNRAHAHSPQMWASHHHGLLATAGAAVGAGLLWLGRGSPQ